MSSNNRIYDAQFSALAKSIAFSFRTQLPPNTISNIVDLESLKSTLTTAIPASVTADLMAQSSEWAKYLSDLSSPVSLESVKSIASAASQLFANYDFSQITKAYSPAGDNTEPAPDEEVDVPPEVYELVDSIEEATATPISSQEPEITEALRRRPRRMSAKARDALVSILTAIAMELIGIAGTWIQGEIRNTQAQQIVSVQQQIKSDRFADEHLECSDDFFHESSVAPDARHDLTYPVPQIEAVDGIQSTENNDCPTSP